MNPPTDLDLDSTMRRADETQLFNSLLGNECVINKGTEEEIVVTGYTPSKWKTVLYWIGVLLTCGGLLLVTYWKPELACYLKMERCALYKAQILLILTCFKEMSVIQVETITAPVEGDNVHGYTQGSLPQSHPDSSKGGASVSSGGRLTTDDHAALTAHMEGETDNGGGFVSASTGPGVRYFDYQKTRYLWDQRKRTFRVLEDLSTGTTCLTIHEQYQGMSDEQRMARLNLYGFNSMDIEVPSYWALFITEVMNPFYIFQIASIILWSCDTYYYYASCIFFISVLSICISLRETRKQRVTLRDMVSTEEKLIKVCTETGTYEEKPERELVPGDLIAIPPNGCIMTCDAVLTAGTCIVNESMLTGESVPVTKTPLLQSEDQEVYSSEEHKRHTLFSGTHIVQTRYYGQAKVTAVVVRTGFNTAKGELVRAILFPKPLDFKFYQDAIRFICFLAVMASMGMIYSLVNFILYGEEVGEMIIRVLDIITIVVPPALPAAMTVGTVYAQNRLKKAKIFCISPPRINFCGRLNVFCFDKTGTLTEDGLDMWGVVPVVDSQSPIPDPSTIQRGPLIVCLATCHSLTIIDGELSGDPLDLIMFKALNWVLEEPGADTHKYDTIMPTVVKPYSADTFLGEEEEFEYLQREQEMIDATSESAAGTSRSIQYPAREHPFEVGIIRQFTFSSSAQRATVITRTMGEDHMDIYCKGAPERVASLCRPETVPQDFHTVLHSYSIQGLRVIALAYRAMDAKITWHQVQRISRDKVEKDLNFLGLLILQNQLKPQTKPVIRTLKQANIRSVMITGDMLQTAVSVARNCGMVGPKERVILAHAHPPDPSKGQNQAYIEWEEAEHGAAEITEEAAGPAEIETDQEPSDGRASPSSSIGSQTLNQPLLNDDAEQGSRSQGSWIKNWNIGGEKSNQQRGYGDPTGTINGEFSPKGFSTVDLEDDLSHRKHVAINGKSFAVICNHMPQLLPKLVVQGTVFARMSPEQKCMLIEQLQHLDYMVGMCGDGANDCEALKAAHAGISLSEAEASVAAPFTSSMNNIECVVTAVREGRAALVTSFGSFKYMALYSFIQFVSVLILYTYLANLSDFEYLYVDLVITTSIAILMGNTDAYEKLVKKKPSGSLVKPSNLVSIITQTLIIAGTQAAAFFYLTTESFYWDDTSDTNSTMSGDDFVTSDPDSYTWESTTIFLISCYLYITSAYTFSTGPPFRKRIYTNVWYSVCLVLLWAFSTFILIWPQRLIVEFLNMKPLQDTPLTFRLTILGMAFAAFFISIITEWVVMESGWLKCLYRWIDRVKGKQPKGYKVVAEEISERDWPPVDQNDDVQSTISVEDEPQPIEVLVDIH